MGRSLRRWGLRLALGGVLAAYAASGGGAAPVVGQGQPQAAPRLTIESYPSGGPAHVLVITDQQTGKEFLAVLGMSGTGGVGLVEMGRKGR